MKSSTEFAEAGAAAGHGGAGSIRPGSISRRGALAWLLGAGAATGRAAPALAGSAMPLMLAHSYRPGHPVEAYGVSEKYDGVRGYWDGLRLWTRGGEAVAAPAWFTAALPAQPVDGELWAGHGRFESAVSIVRRRTPDDGAWRQLKFMAFDLPAHAGPFSERAAALAPLLTSLGRPWVIAVAQSRVEDHAGLRALMEKTVRDGGEGLMLHRLDSAYRAGRSHDLLKYKPEDDADARVLAHVAGRGKFEAMMGALLVETPEGLRFKLGSGFNDAQRRAPPAVGSWISYRFRGETGAGLPRFASFLRVRADIAA